MSVTSGFFNSVNHDRRYNAAQMSAIFDGIINDGVFANIGVAFAVIAHTGVTISIGKGRAWFNSAWVYNDGPLLKTLEGSEVVLDRIDAVVIEVDHNENVRLGDIKIVKGTPASAPQRPKMAAETYKHQYPLAYIYRKAGSTTITQADITSMIGTSSCPYITGILQVQNIDNIVAQWGAQWNQWYSEMVAETNTDASALMAEMRSEFEIWFRDVGNILEGDIGANLAAQVAELMGKFDDLARDACVYDTIEDSDLNVILGSDGTPIQGKTVFSGSGGGSVEGVAAKDIGAVAIDGSTPMTGNLDVNQNRIMNVAEPEEDSDAASAGYVKSVVKNSKTPSTIRNLLINSDFTNPVNQNGQTTYSAVGPNIDRWLAGQARPITVSDNGIVLDGTNGSIVMRQKLEGLKDGVYTMAVNVGEVTQVRQYKKEGTTYTRLYTNEDYPGGYSVLLNNSGVPEFQFRANSGSIVTAKWAALYEGEYTEETLPEYHSIGYENELLVCRQYDPNTGEYIGLRKFGAAHNLLNNSDFTNPVNRKGLTSCATTGSARVYFIDGWAAENLTASLDGKSVKLSPNGNGSVAALAQFFDIDSFPYGKILTYVINTSEGVIHSIVQIPTREELEQRNSSQNLGQVFYNGYKSYIRFSVSNNTIGYVKFDVCAEATTTNPIWLYNAALYEGAYTIDTLPEYQPKGYEQELLICNQYDINTGEYIGLRKFNTAHNLLDNSDFTNPVNQRGTTSYTGSGYTIDRWYSHPNNEHVTLNSNSITVKAKSGTLGWFTQKLEGSKFLGKTCTAAIKLANGEVVLCTGTFPSSYATSEQVIARTDTDAINVNLFWYADKTAAFRLRINGTTVTIAWAALYEGVYTAETLPEYRPKGYGVELAECQRYYQKYDRYDTVGYVTTSATDYVMEINLPVSMRVRPSVSTFNYVARLYNGGYSKHTTSAGKATTTINVYSGNAKDTGAFVICDKIGTSAGDTNNSILLYTITNLQLSADL